MANKGTSTERRLVNLIQERGWYVQRAGASGAGTDRARADVTAIIDSESGGSTVLLIENKAWSEGIGRFSKEEVHELQGIAQRTGGTALLTIWPDQRVSRHDGIYAFQPDELNENQKSYSVRQQDIQDATLLTSILERCENEGGQESHHGQER